MSVYTLKPIMFMPYAETGEFACVGVVLYSHDGGCFRYRICKRNDLDRLKTRVHGFFPELPEDIFAASIKYVKAELHRVDLLTKDADLFVSSQDVVGNLCRPRENIIRFGAGRVLACDNVDSEIERQYKQIVLRGFIDSEGLYVHQMKRMIKAKIKKAKLHCKYDHKVKAPHSYDLTIPFFFDEFARPQALDPLDLRKETPKAVDLRMNQWVFHAGIINNEINGIKIMCPTRFPDKGTESYDAAMDWIEKGRNLFVCTEYSEDAMDTVLSQMARTFRI